MSAALRIAVPIHSFEPGGVERVALGLCAAWQVAGAEVAVVLGRREGAMAPDAPSLNYLLEPEPIPTRGFETLWMMWRMIGYLRRNPADVIFCSGNTYAVVIAVLKLVLGRHCPPVAIKISNDLERRDLPQPVRWFYHRWLRIQGRLIDHFVGMAAPMRDEIARWVGVPDDRITIIEDPSLGEEQYAALCALPRGAVPPAGAHYLSIGRLARQKNFPVLLRAFALLADKTSRLTILGEGGERARLEKLARQLGIVDRVALPGHSNATSAALGQADCFVMSSDYEGVPAVTIEALAAGLPIASTACSVSMHGLLGDGAFGILVPPRDPAALAGAMADACVMPFDPAAARRAAAPFRLSQAAPRYLALFQSLTKSAKAAPA
ncbi:glycosyltransferase [Novosphingobium aquiterrae]|uniref:Glycosyltransferase n=1 Tax=Novosphingobium aquiterrae TaxID=624388 RepID=A0ABV6PFN7_9SPHN